MFKEAEGEISENNILVAVLFVTVHRHELDTASVNSCVVWQDHLLLLHVPGVCSSNLCALLQVPGVCGSNLCALLHVPGVCSSYLCAAVFVVRWCKGTAAHFDIVEYSGKLLEVASAVFLVCP